MSKSRSILYATLTTVVLAGVVIGAALGVRASLQVPEPTVEPKMVDPGPPGGPPADAIVLFNGKDLSQWQSTRAGGEAKWLVKDGAMEVVRGTGDIQTKQEFGDVQLHVEWATPAEVKGEGQDALYAYLTSGGGNKELAGEVKWNFQKYLIDRNGRLVEVFPSKVEPMSDEMTSAIESLL